MTMALPFSRYYTPGSNEIVGGSVFVACQDVIVRFFRRRARLQRRVMLFAANRFGSEWSQTTLNPTSTAGAQTHVIPLLLKPGDVIHGFGVNYNKGGASNGSAELRHAESDTNGGYIFRTPLLAFSAPMVGAAATWLTATDTTSPDLKVLANRVYWIGCESAQSGDQVQYAFVDISHPGS